MIHDANNIFGLLFILVQIQYNIIIIRDIHIITKWDKENSERKIDIHIQVIVMREIRNIDKDPGIRKKNIRKEDSVVRILRAVTVGGEERIKIHIMIGTNMQYQKINR